MIAIFINVGDKHNIRTDWYMIKKYPKLGQCVCVFYKRRKTLVIQFRSWMTVEKLGTAK